MRKNEVEGVRRVPNTCRDISPTAPADHPQAEVVQSGAAGKIEQLHFVAADGQRAQPNVCYALAMAHVELAQSRCVPGHAPKSHVRDLISRKCIRSDGTATLGVLNCCITKLERTIPNLERVVLGAYSRARVQLTNLPHGIASGNAPPVVSRF